MNEFNNEIIENTESYEKRNVFNRAIKRFMDLFFSIIGLLLSFPIITLFAILVIIETPGNPFYTQERLGRYGKKFNIIKIRSMYNDAEKNGAQWAEKNDARITKIGNFIRNTRIDELPQLINIILGDMSLVGPRPEREEFTNEFCKDIYNFRDRLVIKPGLTGWAQVNGGYNLSPYEKINYDLEYIRNQSIIFDVKIILLTIKVVFTGDGAR